MVHPCQRKPEIELQLDMHNWMCFIIYNTRFIFNTPLNAVSFFRGAAVLLTTPAQPPPSKVL